jgi:hypothetical protein
MQFYTHEECEEWVKRRTHRPDGPLPQLPDVTPGLFRKDLKIPDDAHVLHQFARTIAEEMQQPPEPTLFWATNWSSFSPWHLYYRLRQSYGDLRLLAEAPGHLFLTHETEDFASFLSIAMANYWDGYLLPVIDHVSAELHDVFMHFYSDTEQNLDFVDELAKRWPDTEIAGHKG